MSPQTVKKLKNQWECQWSHSLYACYDLAHPTNPHTYLSHPGHHGTHEPTDLALEAVHITHLGHTTLETAHAAKHAGGAARSALAAKNAASVGQGVSETAALLGQSPAVWHASTLKDLTIAWGRPFATQVGGKIVPSIVLAELAINAVDKIGFAKVECLTVSPHAKQADRRNCKAVYDDPERITKFLNLSEKDQQDVMKDVKNLDGQFTCRYYRGLLEMLELKPKLSALNCDKPNEFSIEATFPDDTVIKHTVKYEYGKPGNVASIENQFSRAGKIFARRFASKIYVTGEQIQGFDHVNPDPDPGENLPSSAFTAITIKRYIPDARECCLTQDDRQRKACREALLSGGRSGGKASPKTQGAETAI